jgi:hypothetical protein
MSQLVKTKRQEDFKRFGARLTKKTSYSQNLNMFFVFCQKNHPTRKGEEKSQKEELPKG